MVILYTTRKAKNKEMITDNIIILPIIPCMPFNIPEARSLLLIAADKEFNFNKTSSVILMLASTINSFSRTTP